ncbi:unnamed protein product [Aphanomyces euteiches]
MAALWKANHPKCIVGIVDTVLVQDRKPISWLFTAKTGEVLRKKTCSIADIVDRFTRISLANDRNVHRHVCVARKTNGSAFVWNAAKLGDNMEAAAALDPHIVALQPFVCSRGGIGAIYRHEIKQPGTSRAVHSTAKLFHHEMSSNEPSIAVEPPRESTKSNATTINSRLHAISTLVCRHLEEVQQIRIHHFVVDFIVDDDDQIWLAWMPQVDFEAKRSASSISELSSSDLTLLASTSSHLGFPTAFKCCGDFCRFELADDRRNTAMDKVEHDNNATRRRQIESLFPQTELDALGAAHLESLVQFAPAVEDDRGSYTITYRSIALAKRHKEHWAGASDGGQTRERGAAALPTYMQSTISKEFRAGLNKLYGQVDGGTANYYRHVKVCPTCFAVYSMLDHSREMLAKQEEAKKLKTAASSDSFHGALPVIESPGRATPRPSSRDGQVVVESVPTTLTPSTLPTMPPLQHVKSKPWKAQASATKTAEDFVGLDQYLRGHAKWRKQKILTRNALFPSSCNNKTAAKYAKQPPQPQQPLPCSSSSILIVDTDQDVINSIVAAFQAQYLIDSVCDGAVALKCAQENHYDAIVCGRDMPSLGAIELTKLLRQFELHQSLPGTAKSRRRTPVLCLTSHTAPEDLRVYMEVGMDGCLALPLDMNALQELLQTAIASSIDTLPKPSKPSMSKAATAAAAAKKQPAVKKKKSSQGASAATKSTDDAAASGHVFHMDADTTMPFAVLNRPTLQSINTFFNLVIVHDIFDTMERLEILLAPLLARYPGAQALLWNYPGQAFTTWRHGVLLNNVYLASCLDHLLDHVLTLEMLREKQPFYLIGFGNGASIAMQFALHGASKTRHQLRALVSINGFSYVDAALAEFFHDAIKVFSCTPESRPDLAVYFHARHLFSGAYLATVSTPLALNLYTAVSNPIRLDGRIALCLGALSHVDLQPELKSLDVPLILVAAAQNALVQPHHVDSIVAARGHAPVASIHEALKHRQKPCVVWIQAGHEVFQECKPVMLLFLEQCLTGFHETHADNKLGAAAAVGQSNNPPKALLESKTRMPARLGSSYEDQFIHKILTTLKDVKKQDADSSSSGGGSHGVMAVLDPTHPSFERDSNRIYHAGDGSKIYPASSTTRADVKEYMTWRVQRNAARLARLTKLAVKIQKAYRAYRARTLAARVRREAAARLIQRVYRGFVGRTIFQTRRRQDWAVRLVQRAWRGKMGRMRFKSTKSERLAAIELQRIVRGWQGRVRVQWLKQRRFRAACMIQSLFKRLRAMKEAWRARERLQGAMTIQRVYRGHVGRRRAAMERDRFLFSKAQSHQIDFGKQMLVEYKLLGTRLQSEVELLVAEKTKTEAQVETLLSEIADLEAGVRVLETEMHSLSRIETEAKGVLDEQAKWQLRDQKMRLDREFGHMLKTIADRREKLSVLSTTLQTLDKTRHAKQEDLRSLERKLVLLLDEQQRALQGIKAKQEKRSQVLVDMAGGLMEPGVLGSSGEGGGGGVAVHPGTVVSPEQRQEANALMESTETMMKFGFMSMSMTYFSSMNMIKAMRQIGAHHTFLESAAAIHNAAAGSIGGSKFQAEPPPGSFPGQQPKLTSGWSVQDVGRWLDSLTLGQYKQAFADGSVDGALLFDLNDHDLRYSLGIEYELHRKKILQTVERLKIAEGRLTGYTTTSSMNDRGALPVAAVAVAGSPSPIAAFNAPPIQSVQSMQAPVEAPPVSMAPAQSATPLAIPWDDLCSLVRNGKLKAIKEALEKWPDKPFDPLTIKTQYVQGGGTIYEDSTEHLAIHINKSDDHGNTLLILAAQNNLLKVAQFLVSKGANPNHQNKQGQTAGHYAMAYNFFDLGAWLLDPDKGGGRDDLANIYGLSAYDGLNPS